MNFCSMMKSNEIRKDYALKRRVIIASNRGKRPEDFKKQARVKAVRNGKCSFCPGSEYLTPPEISRVVEEGEWIIRCFPNKYPATHNSRARKKTGFLNSVPALGRHEVIVETPKHDGSVSELPVGHIIKLLDVYQERISALNSLKRVGYTLVFKNVGATAGASLAHTHSQVIALPDAPDLVREEAEAYSGKMGCVFCRVMKKELKSERRVFENEHAGAFAPYASRFPFEVWIMPKRHVKSIGDLSLDEKTSFADALKHVLARMNRGLGFPPYNYYLHVSPKKADLHFHLELCPKTTKLAGFELGSGMYINTISPEDAARFFRGGDI